jgi:hypothetical protein
MRRARARERASALRSRDDGTGTFSSSACFLEDRANSWQEQAYCRRRLRLGGNEVSAGDEFEVLLEQHRGEGK